MALGILLIILGFVFFFLIFPFHVLLGVVAIVLGILDLFWAGRTWRTGYGGPRRYYY
jgi:5-bromo-4-chloroindolyl phosphate hydrolysis protein